MLVACWSAKGGSGTTVVSAALALLVAGTVGPTLAADLAGDLAVALGLPPDGPAPGLADWLVAVPDVPADAIGRLEEPVGIGLSLLRHGPPPRGGAPPAVDPDEAGAVLAAVLAADPRPVVVDCGRIDPAVPSAADAVVAAADQSLLVLRSCYLGVVRAAACPTRPNGVVLLQEEGRSLSARDVESVLDVPVLAEVRVTAAVARTVDAGLLGVRLPRTLALDLRRVA